MAFLLSHLAILLLIASQVSATTTKAPTTTTKAPTTKATTTKPPTTKATTTKPPTTKATTTKAPTTKATTTKAPTTTQAPTTTTIKPIVVNTTVVPTTTVEAIVLNTTVKAIVLNTTVKAIVLNTTKVIPPVVLNTTQGPATTAVPACAEGYFRNSNGTCEKEGPVFKAAMKLTMNFTADLNNPNSAEFKNLAKTVGDGLLASLKASLQGVKRVDITGFKSGSVIAEYNIVFANNAPAVNATSIQAANNNAITTGSFGNLPVDKTYLPEVKEKEEKPKPKPKPGKGLSAGLIFLIIIIVIVVVPLLIYGVIKYKQRSGYERAEP